VIGFDRQQRRRRFVRGVLVGLVAAGTMATCMAPPKARAEPFATASAGQVIVTLRTDQGPLWYGTTERIWRPIGAALLAPVTRLRRPRPAGHLRHGRLLRPARARLLGARR
jgi:hypothetical protein